MKLAGLTATVILAVTTTSAAHAYVRTTTENHTPISWPSSCLTFVPSSSALPTGIDLATFTATIDQAMANWRVATSPCSNFEMSRLDPQPVLVLHDNLSVIKFNTQFWTHGDTATGASFDSATKAITTVSFIDKKGVPNDGTILDADIELNATDYQFVILPSDSMFPNESDLENTLTHEMGHAQGLAHTCYIEGDPIPLDENGQPLPDCEHSDPVVAATTMFAIASPSDIDKRYPKADDVAGICAIYPLTASACGPPLTAATQASAGCQLNPTDKDTTFPVLCLIGVLARLQFRRRLRAQR